MEISIFLDNYHLRTRLVYVLLRPQPELLTYLLWYCSDVQLSDAVRWPGYHRLQDQSGRPKQELSIRLHHQHGQHQLLSVSGYHDPNGVPDDCLRS